MRTFGWIASVILLSLAAAAEDAVFRDVQFPSAKGELTNATLSFSDEDKLVEVRVSDGRVFSFPYAQIDSISNEYTSKHRIKEAIVLGLFSPWGAGAVIGLTKSKKHWLEIDFHDQDKPRALVLNLDRRDYRKVCDAAQAHTGKDVALVGKTDTKLIKGKL